MSTPEPPPVGPSAAPPSTPVSSSQDTSAQRPSSAVQVALEPEEPASGQAAPIARPSPQGAPRPPQHHTQTQAQAQTQTQASVRPWWRPPARNFRAHPGNALLHSYATNASSVAASHSPGTAATTSVSPSHSAAPLHAHSESLPRYWLRAFNYILRIPFRELIGNISRPYDPAAPDPLPDVPLNATITNMPSNQPSTDSNRGWLGSMGGYVQRLTPTATMESGTTPVQSTTRSRGYLPQIRKAWGDRTSDMSWAISTAFFTSVICTVVAVAALVLNWQANCTYLKVFLIAFVVRKWIMSYLMMDRALYRLPLGLVKPDPDIDDERHNGVAIYMSSLFTWHGYTMLICGSFYVFFYGASRYMGVAPVITGVSIAFSCMGLIPFFGLLVLMLGALVLLYVFYILFICLVWPLEKCSVSRRRAASHRSGGYRSDGTTNTTDIRQIEQAVRDAENDRSRRRSGFARTDNIKETAAMATIPIIIFRKPKVSQPAGQVEIVKDVGDNQDMSSRKNESITTSSSGTSLAQSSCSSSKDSANEVSQSSAWDPESEHEKNGNHSTIVQIDGTDNVAHDRISNTHDNIVETPGSTFSATSKATSVSDKSDHGFPAGYPTITDEECAICLFDFEDGDELRHLYCDHFFHRGCVDRWLTKHAFCPKCKRGI
ncbi:hypothetical protein B0O80DRAFT_129033 [Mortierella sp. GBAus27b]|nr:hypothetical protein BGX31_008761 [Mortierella sp. GBA43]KAI8350463.1 hypothetical protein B0O80DRAFT_129033 [Mortierella sp. GBAus27b]